MWVFLNFPIVFQLLHTNIVFGWHVWPNGHVLVCLKIYFPDLLRIYLKLWQRQLFTSTVYLYLNLYLFLAVFVLLYIKIFQQAICHKFLKLFPQSQYKTVVPKCTRRDKKNKSLRGSSFILNKQTIHWCGFCSFFSSSFIIPPYFPVSTFVPPQLIPIIRSWRISSCNRNYVIAVSIPYVVPTLGNMYLM